MATACRIGALTAGLDADADRRADNFRRVPSAWSSRSATTCSTSSPARSELGKPPGQDLAEGIYTLPGATRPRRPSRRAEGSRRCSAPTRSDRARRGASPRRDLDRHRRSPATIARDYTEDRPPRLPSSSGGGLVPEALVELGHERRRRPRAFDSDGARFQLS